MKKRRKWSTFLTVLLTLCSICASSFSAQAAPKELPDLNRKGSITVTLKDPETKNPITTGVVTIRKVASVKVDGANYSFVYTKDFAACAYPLDNLDSRDLAEALAIYAGKNNLAGTDSTIDKDGNVTFHDLEPGLYLVTYTASEDYQAVMSPFLVTIPITEGNGLTYDVDATPKLDITPPDKPDNPGKPDKPDNPDNPGKPDKPDNPDNPGKPGQPDKPDTPSNSKKVLPQTGQLWWPVPVLVLLGLMFIAFGWRRRNHE